LEGPNPARPPYYLVPSLQASPIPQSPLLALPLRKKLTLGVVETSATLISLFFELEYQKIARGPSDEEQQEK